MPLHRDPRPEARLVEHYAGALAAARKQYPGLSRADHEDVVQEAIAAVLARLRRGPLEDPAAYLYVVIRHEGGARLRARARELASVSFDATTELEPLDRSLVPRSPEDHVLERDRGVVWQVLRTELTHDERLALARRYLQGFEPDEIAAELGWTARRYRRVIETARRKLVAGVERRRAPLAVCGELDAEAACPAAL